MGFFNDIFGSDKGYTPFSSGVGANILGQTDNNIFGQQVRANALNHQLQSQAQQMSQSLNRPSRRIINMSNNTFIDPKAPKLKERIWLIDNCQYFAYWDKNKEAWHFNDPGDEVAFTLMFKGDD